MNEQQSNFLDGLHVVETELERVIGELDEMYGRLNIHLLEWVSLWPLKWALSKLADDLHKADTEVRNARLEVASAQRETSEAQQKQRDEWQDAQTHFEKWRAELETVKAERDSLNQENEWLRQSKDAAIIEMDKARERLAEIERLTVEAFRGKTVAEVAQLIEATSRTEAELSGNPGRLSADTIARMSGNGTEPEPPEPYQWQVGDVVESDGESPRLVITRDAKGWVFFKESAFGLPQFEWEKLGWKLHRKASELPDIPRFTEQQMADFKAVMAQVSDSVGTDGEGQP